MNRQPLKQIERSIQTTYRKYIWSPFLKAINDYKLIEPGDVIGIAISGGKDSLLMAKLFQMLHRHTDIPFTPVFLSMDPGFNEINKTTMVENCKHLGLDVNYFDSDIFEVVDRISQEYPCYMCARMRRGFLYAKAQELGCNKLALGHHFDDVIETTMLNVLYAGNFKTMVPKLHSANFENLELIRPLYYVREESIKSFITSNGIPAMNCGCRVAAGQTSSKRAEIKTLIANLKEVNPNVDKSIFKSAENINLDAILGYQQHGEKHDFLDIYENHSKN
ncbi:MAG: tRNA 2-thiocytidine biosynthesis TtcA family protein [Cellulosilyticaceae bacterium]